MGALVRFARWLQWLVVRQPPRAQEHPGLATQYNHDLDVSERFAAQFPRIGPLLRPAEVVERFHRYDEISSRAKRRFLFFGAVSISLVTIALVGVTVELLVASLGGHVPPVVTVLIELAALAAFCVLLATRLFRWRARWCLACFARERIRQWHFQMFLNGPLVQGLVVSDPDCRQEQERTWAELMTNLRSAEGTLSDFLHDPRAPGELFHGSRSYTDAAVRDEVFRALTTLRFNHQSQFAHRRLADDPLAPGMPAREHLLWVETVANGALLLAVAAPACQLGVLGLQAMGIVSDIHLSQMLLFATAVLLAILSGSVRAYRTGLTLPEEISSYEEYVARIGELREVFTRGTLAQKYEALKELEVAAATELRRFLTLKSRATFVA